MLQIAGKPVDHLLDSTDSVGEQTFIGEPVTGSRKHDKADRNLRMPFMQSDKQLFTLLKGRADIAVSMEQQKRCADMVQIPDDGRSGTLHQRVPENDRLRLFVWTVHAGITIPVGSRLIHEHTLSDGGAKTVGVHEDAAGERAAVALPGDAQTVRIDKAEGHSGIDRVLCITGGNV